MWETWVQFLGWEDPLEKGTFTHSSFLSWIIPWTEEPGRLQSMGLQSRTRLSSFHKQIIPCVSKVQVQLGTLYFCLLNLALLCGVHHSGVGADLQATAPLPGLCNS